jgi:hypothetical protein
MRKHTEKSLENNGQRVRTITQHRSNNVSKSMSENHAEIIRKIIENQPSAKAKTM